MTLYADDAVRSSRKRLQSEAKEMKLTSASIEAAIRGLAGEDLATTQGCKPADVHLPHIVCRAIPLGMIGLGFE